MITLTEFKQYLNIVETKYDAQLQGFITSAITQLNSLCNREFIKNDYIEVIECNLFSNAIYLKSSPINSVTSIKYYDSNSFVNVSGTIADYVENMESYLYLKNVFSLRGKRLQVVYNGGYKFVNGTGKVKVLTGSANVLGLFDTVFTDEIEVNDYLCFDGLKIKVTAITDDSHLILESPVSEDHISKGFTISNVPEDLRQSCKELATKLYNDSSIGNNALLKSSYSISSQTSGTSTRYKDLDLKNIISNYRFQNV